MYENDHLGKSMRHWHLLYINLLVFQWNQMLKNDYFTIKLIKWIYVSDLHYCCGCTEVMSDWGNMKEILKILDNISVFIYKQLHVTLCWQTPFTRSKHYMSKLSFCILTNRSFLYQNIHTLSKVLFVLFTNYSLISASLQLLLT